MSADNYYYITSHPNGGYAAIMGFASNDYMPSVRDNDLQFTTFQEAWNYANDEYSEYGISIDPSLVKDD